MSLIYSTAIPSAVDFTITGTCKFNDDDSSYMSRTTSSAGNRKTWTLSCWLKRGNLSSGYFFHTWVNDTYRSSFVIDGSNKVQFYEGPNKIETRTPSVLTDPSIWYHVVYVFDTTNGTAADRFKIYVNNSQQSLSIISGSTLASNLDGATNTSGTKYTVGRSHHSTSPGAYFDGYVAEAHFIDGQALTPSSFGDTVDSEWKPIRYSGSYGTNGFYLDFADSGDLGDDESGNGNDFAETNLAASDQVIDSPLNSFCTLDPTDTAGSETWHEGNLKWYSSGSNAGIGRSTTIGDVSSGKWYWEFLVGAGSRAPSLGIVLASEALSSSSYYVGQTSGGYGMFFNGYKYNNGGSSAYGASFGNGDIIGIALDMDNTSITFYKNGSSQGVAWSNISSGAYSPAMGSDQTGRDTTVYANFGQDSSFSGQKTAQGYQDGNDIGDFYYSVPSGYLALCSENQ